MKHSRILILTMIILGGNVEILAGFPISHLFGFPDVLDLVTGAFAPAAPVSSTIIGFRPYTKAIATTAERTWPGVFTVIGAGNPHY